MDHLTEKFAKLGVDSAPGQGTTFSVYLPVEEEER